MANTWTNVWIQMKRGRKPARSNLSVLQCKERKSLNVVSSRHAWDTARRFGKVLRKAKTNRFAFDLFADFFLFLSHTSIAWIVYRCMHQAIAWRTNCLARCQKLPVCLVHYEFTSFFLQGSQCLITYNMYVFAVMRQIKAPLKHEIRPKGLFTSLPFAGQLNTPYSPFIRNCVFTNIHYYKNNL